ncbi:hypothetical protein THRCLA_02123 [Thraustotheca clavata]|uniref:GRAM domain-containing protein n=1 Tax=Thraustotheca clavata TaxID=74557 RepID=A0A1W0A673_9STRA|nr:hypothetical protein THRCLA_02123 [Thraustotheca clavata]
MSVDPILHGDSTPMLISPFERFHFVLNNVKFSILSGSGYPGEGGMYVGRLGRLYLSSYRLIYVETDPGIRQFRSFSLPLHAIHSNHHFQTHFFSYPTYEGLIVPVPGGGLVGIGRFKFTFLGVGFEEFQSFYAPLFANSRNLYEQMQQRSSPSIVQVPGPDAFKRAGNSKKIAFCSPNDPFTLFIQGNSQA